MIAKSLNTRAYAAGILPSAERYFSAYCFSFCALASAQNEKPKKGSTSLPQARKQNRALRGGRETSLARPPKISYKDPDFRGPPQREGCGGIHPPKDSLFPARRG